MCLWSCFCICFLIGNIYSSEASQIADCCCDTETIDGHNNKFVNHILSEIRQRTFFRIFQVALYRDCQFWPDNSLCYKPTCSVAQCCDEEIPAPWKDEKLEKVDTFITNPFDTWINEDEDQWVSTDPPDSAVYVDLERNPDGYTGYKGAEAGRVWKAIYEAKRITFSKIKNNGKNDTPDCTNDKDGIQNTNEMDMEERVLYRLISGFHTLTSAMVFANYPLNEEATEFGPNVDLYERFLHPNAEYINNLYFDFVFLLRAVNKASHIIKDYDYNTGNVDDDAKTKQLITKFIDTDFIQSQCSVQNSFDESALFKDTKECLMDDCRRVFRNISEILDCVGCDKCKLHAKMEFLGLGTALKILFTKDALTTDFLQRNELIALIVTLSKYSDAVKFINDMEARIATKKADNDNHNQKDTPLKPDTITKASSSRSSSGKTQDEQYGYSSNQELFDDFISFIRDFERLKNLNEWKRWINILTDVNDVNDFLEYPRNVIIVLFLSFILTLTILINQLFMYCPDTNKHENLQQHEMDKFLNMNNNGNNDNDNDNVNASTTSLHAGEKSVKRSGKNSSQNKKKRRRKE